MPRPGMGQVRIKVQACGICHSDVLTKEGALPGIQYHEFQDMKSRASLMKSATVFPSGSRGSALASDGTAARTAHVSPAGAAIFAIAGT